MTSEAPELLPCPFCGKPARVFGSNMVGCEDQSNCGANVDWGHYTKGDGPKQAWNRRADLSPQWRPISEAEDGDRIIVAGWQHQSGGTIGYWWYHEDVAWDGKATEHPSATHFTSISLPPFPEAPNEP